MFGCVRRMLRLRLLVAGVCKARIGTILDSKHLVLCGNRRRWDAHCLGGRGMEL